MKIYTFAFLFFALVSCSTNLEKQSEVSGERIRIFYNNDNFSYLERCGCRVSPIGGVDRRWNAMQAYPKETRLFLDAGNLLFKTIKAPDYLVPQWFEQAVGVVEAYNLLGADAATVGQTEFSLGVKKFQELAAKASFPFISSNIYYRGTKNLFLKDSVILKKMGKKIGVFGLFLPSLILPEELEAKDPISTAKEMVKKLRSEGVDMVIALSHQGYDEDVKLARAVKGIDLIIGAHSQSLLQRPDTEGDSLLVQLSNQGQMLGMVEYDSKDFPHKRTDFIVAELNADYDVAPKDIANPMKNLVAVTNLRMAEANKKLEAQIWDEHGNRAQAGASSFETFLSCRDCHTVQAHFQEGKPHAASFLTLMHAKQENNMDCVKCHSVGLGQSGGFDSLTKAFLDAEGNPVPLDFIRKHLGSLKGGSYRAKEENIRPDVEKWIASLKKAKVKKAFVSVQCESCHGQLPGHPFAEMKPRKVSTQTCLQCHTPEQAPAWYNGKVPNKDVIDAALKKMTCPR